MLSDRDLRILDGLARGLEKDAPRLVKRLRRFDRGWLIRRFSAAIIGSGAGIGFVVAALAIRVGWSTWAFGLALLTASGWEAARRGMLLHDLRRATAGGVRVAWRRRPPDQRPEQLC